MEGPTARKAEIHEELPSLRDMINFIPEYRYWFKDVDLSNYEDILDALPQLDTKYKKTLFGLCNGRSKETTVTELGMKMHAEKVSFAVVDESEWESQFNALFSS